MQNNGLAQDSFSFQELTPAGTFGMDGQMSNNVAMDMIEEWLTLPFDSSCLPQIPDTGTQGFSWIDDGSLDFIWNLQY
jgi:hypothetical protein